MNFEFLEIQDKIACSAGSACHSNETNHVSHVLTAIGLPLEYALGTLRLSVGRESTQEEMKRAGTIVAKAVNKLAKRQEIKQVPVDGNVRENTVEVPPPAPSTSSKTVSDLIAGPEEPLDNATTSSPTRTFPATTKLYFKASCSFFK